MKTNTLLNRSNLATPRSHGSLFDNWTILFSSRNRNECSTVSPEIAHLTSATQLEETQFIHGHTRTRFQYYQKVTATSEVASDAEPSLSVLHTVQTDLEYTTSGSGSGRGQPMLACKTVARSVRLLEIIGRGRYGEVWRGELCGEMVAVKIFASSDEASWRRESSVFNDLKLQHENIVNFYASDVRARGSFIELWLIISVRFQFTNILVFHLKIQLQYYKNGSLYDFLVQNTVDFELALKFSISIMRGLHYIHTALGLKPQMAHRDLKSKNLLIKNDFSVRFPFHCNFNQLLICFLALYCRLWARCCQR